MSSSKLPPGAPSDPPPSYDSPEIWSDSSNRPSQYPNDKPQPAPLSPCPHPSSTPHHPLSSQPPGPRILHIYSNSLLGRDLTILDNDKTTTAYTISANRGTIFSEKPHMRIYRGPLTPTPQPVGTVTFHNYSSTIDLTLHNRPVIMENRNILTVSHQFQSGIGPLSWKSNGWGSDLILMTQGKEWLAKFDGNHLSVDKRGTLEIVSWDIQDVGLDEIVVSGMAMVEHMRRRRRR